MSGLDGRFTELLIVDREDSRGFEQKLGIQVDTKGDAPDPANLG